MSVLDRARQFVQESEQRALAIPEPAERAAEPTQTTVATTPPAAVESLPGHRHCPPSVGGHGGLVDAATKAAPRIALTLRASGDEAVDLRRLQAIASVIKPYQGQFTNRMCLRLIEASGETRLEWKADPIPGLRWPLTALLADWATKPAPADACPACHEDQWWARPEGQPGAGRRVCGVCHPDPETVEVPA